MKVKKERLYKQLLTLKKHYKKLIKTELYNIEELKAEKTAQVENSIQSTDFTDFNLVLTSFN